MTLLLAAFAWLIPRSSEAQLPVLGNTGIHDPSPLVQQGSTFFVYGDGQGIDGLTSTDLRNWTAVSPVFPGGPPGWTTNAVPGFTGYFWAPDVVYMNGKYYLYYCCSEWGTINSAIGLVTSPSLTAPVWTDQGKIIQSNPDFATNATTDLTAYNCIDPSILQDTNGTVWMSFGSYSDGILIMQLDPTTGKRLSPTSPIYRVANNGPYFFSSTEEASFLYQHGGYYYLFENWGGCCAGVDSTYNIRVGRSPTVQGPYFDRNGINLTNAGGTMVLESTARYIGPGQAGIYTYAGTNWFTYHYYDGLNNGVATLGLNYLTWSSDGWPQVTNDWSAFYPLNRDAHEHLGLYNGTLKSNATLTNEPGRGRVLRLDGSSNYLSMPLEVANASTFAGWVKWNGGAPWQRIFDLGASTTNYCFLTPAAYGGGLRFAITTNGNGGEQQINAPFALPSNSWCHVAVSLNGTTGLLYLNGYPVATNSALTIRPWQLLADNNNLGKSQFAGDPYFGGEISSFRVFGRALSATEIQALAYAHPALAHRYSFTGNPRDAIGMAHGSLYGDAVVTNNALSLDGTTGTYMGIPGGLVSGSVAVSLEFWATFGANGNWARVVDFGNISGTTGTQYFFFSPHNNLGEQQMESSSSSTTILNSPGTLDGRKVHVVCLVDPTNNSAAIYTNGVLEQSLTGAWPKFNTVSTAWSFVGRSLFAADPYLNGSINELRLYDGLLTTNEIAANEQAGPDQLALPVALNWTHAAGSLAFSWPSWAVGFTLESTTNLATGTWNPVAPAPVLTNNVYSVSLLTTGAMSFYRLQR